MRHRFRDLLHFANAVKPNGKMAVRRNRVARLFSPRSSGCEIPPRAPIARFARGMELCSPFRGRATQGFAESSARAVPIFVGCEGSHFV